jgi:hypothetical protein
MSRARVVVLLSALAIGAACGTFGSTPDDPTVVDAGGVDAPPVDKPPGVTDGGTSDAPGCIPLEQKGCPGAPCCSGSCDEFGFCMARCVVQGEFCGIGDAAPCCSGFRCESTSYICCAVTGTKCDPDANADTCCNHACNPNGLCT